MKLSKREQWRGFTDHQAMCWAVSAYLAASKAMNPGDQPDCSDFAERFIGELQARIYLDSCRKNRPVALETLWNLDFLASQIDSSFLFVEKNDLPGSDNHPDNPQNRGLQGG